MLEITWRFSVKEKCYKENKTHYTFYFENLYYLLSNYCMKLLTDVCYLSYKSYFAYVLAFIYLHIVSNTNVVVSGNRTLTIFEKLYISVYVGIRLDLT